jgi:polar amino acid transport system substrate-binding protein
MEKLLNKWVCVPPKWDGGTMVGRYIAVLLLGLLLGAAVGYAIPKQGSCLFERSKFSDAPSGEVTIIYGFDANYPPFTVMQPNGTPVGFDVDLMNLIAEKYGWKIVYKPWDWSTIVTALENGDIDVIASGMTFNAARSQKIWFSVPYYSYVHQLVVRSEDKRSFDEILNSNEYIAVQLGSTSDEWADRLIKAGYKFKKLGLDSYVSALEALLDGRASAVITDSAFLGPYLKKDPDLAAKVKVLGSIGAPNVYAIATRPQDKWLRDKINEALEELMNSPKWNELLKKWGLD